MTDLFGGAGGHPILDDPKPRARLPLFDDSYAPPVLDQAIARTAKCKRCDLQRRHVKHVCMGGGGKTGGTLVVLESPSQGDDAEGKFKGSLPINRMISGLLAAYEASRGPIRWTWATSCPARKRATDNQIEACRPYLAGEFDAGPKIALVFGPQAVQAVTGYAMDPRWLRRGWARVKGVPCYFFPALYVAAGNRHHKKALQDDIRWALSQPPDATERDMGGEVQIALTVEQGRDLLAKLKSGVLTSYDTEHWPQDPWAKKFEFLCMGIHQVGGDPIVLPAGVVEHLGPEVARILSDPATPKAVANGKHDRHVVWRVLGIDVRGIDWDTQTVAQLIASDDRKGLGPLAWQVGLGGFKSIGQSGADDEEDE